MNHTNLLWTFYFIILVLNWSKLGPKPLWFKRKACTEEYFDRSAMNSLIYIAQYIVSFHVHVLRHHFNCLIFWNFNTLDPIDVNFLKEIQMKWMATRNVTRVNWKTMLNRAVCCLWWIGGLEREKRNYIECVDYGI